MSVNKHSLFEYIAFRVATRYLKQNHLYDEIIRLRTEHKSTGVNLIDYAVLFEYIKRFKPQYVLECGTGLSTHILASAMLTYCKSSFSEIKLISMESELKWHQEAKRHFNFGKYDFVEILLSNICDFRYSFISGVVYENVPDYPYDFVFVDGPNPGDKCDMDFIKVVMKSTKNVSAMIDSRKTTTLAYSVLFAKDRLVCHPFGFSNVKNVSKDNLILSSKASLHHSFDENIPKTYGMFVKGFISSLFLCLLPMRLFD